MSQQQTRLGRIKNLVSDKGFGFINEEEGKTEFFFHKSGLEGVSFADLVEGQAVSFEVGESPKGPRAEHIRPV